MSVQVAITPASQPMAPRSSLYTCLACQVAFHSSEKQRNHYRTDWHKYNLKRKVAELAPITAEQFAQKVLGTASTFDMVVGNDFLLIVCAAAQQARGREEEERQELVYDCMACQKTYRSEQAFTNHVQSKKHKELELRAEELHSLPKEAIVAAVSNGRLLEDEDDDAMSDNHSYASRLEHIEEPDKDCLFCRHHALDMEANLKHMQISHGFFLPDPDYLKDTTGFLHHLTNKLVQEHLCLYCNGRGKDYRSLEAVRAHMIDRGHCKVSFETIGDLEEVIDFYDYDLSVIESAMDVDEAASKTGQSSDLVETELVLPSGTRIGHRSFNVYYRQSLRPIDARDSVAANRLLIENGERAESLSKSQRRRHHQLAISNGSASVDQEKQSLQSLKQKQRFDVRMGMRNNGLMKHYREQNPM